MNPSPNIGFSRFPSDRSQFPSCSAVPACARGWSRTPPAPPVEGSWTSMRGHRRRRTWPLRRPSQWPTSWQLPVQLASSRSEPSTTTSTTTSSPRLAMQRPRFGLWPATVTKCGPSRLQRTSSTLMVLDSSVGFPRFPLKFPTRRCLRKNRRRW